MSNTALRPHHPPSHTSAFPLSIHFAFQLNYHSLKVSLDLSPLLFHTCTLPSPPPHWMTLTLLSHALPVFSLLLQLPSLPPPACRAHGSWVGVRQLEAKCVIAEVGEEAWEGWVRSTGKMGESMGVRLEDRCFSLKRGGKGRRLQGLGECTVARLCICGSAGHKNGAPG